MFVFYYKTAVGNLQVPKHKEKTKMKKEYFIVQENGKESPVFHTYAGKKLHFDLKKQDICATIQEIMRK